MEQNVTKNDAKKVSFKSILLVFLRYSELKRPGADDNTERLIDLIDLMAVILARIIVPNKRRPKILAY